MSTPFKGLSTGIGITPSKPTTQVSTVSASREKATGSGFVPAVRNAGTSVKSAGVQQRAVQKGTTSAAVPDQAGPSFTAETETVNLAVLPKQRIARRGTEQASTPVRSNTKGSKFVKQPKLAPHYSNNRASTTPKVASSPMPPPAKATTGSRKTSLPLTRSGGNSSDSEAYMTS